MATDAQSFYLRVGGLIVVCTLLLTASFVGVLALFSGEISAVASRIPWYLVVTAGFFVGTIVILEESNVHGRAIITTALLAGFFGGGAVALGFEGLLYTLENPKIVLGSQLGLYFLAAGLIATGIGYWALNHWREFSGQQQGQL